MHVKGDSCCLAGFRSNGKLISLYLCVTSIHILDVSPGSLLSTVIQLLWRNMDSSVPVLAVNLQLRKRSICSPVKLRCHWLTALFGLVPFPYSLPQQEPTNLRGAASPSIGFAALFFFPLLRRIDGVDPCLTAVWAALLLPHHSSEVWFTHALEAEPFFGWDWSALLYMTLCD